MDLGLKNKHVLITGSSRGIGLAIAESFLQEDAKTCLVSRGSNALFESEKKLQDTYGLESVFACKCSGPLILDTFQATFSNSAIF